MEISQSIYDPRYCNSSAGAFECCEQGVGVIRTTPTMGVYERICATCSWDWIDGLQHLPRFALQLAKTNTRRLLTRTVTYFRDEERDVIAARCVNFAVVYFIQTFGVSHFLCITYAME